MFDFRLKVFHSVAKRLSFTKAAQELFITQPAVTKHIQELELHYGNALFERKGNKVALTAAGHLLLNHTENIFTLYRQLEFDMNLLHKAYSGQLRVGASTTLAQYVLPAILASFHQQFKEVKISLMSGNTEQIEQALIAKEIDIGLIEGKTKQSDIKYTQLVKDEIVLVAKIKNQLVKKEEIKVDELLKLPLLMREPGSGTLEVIEDALKKAGLKLTDLSIEMHLGSTESIKSYLTHSNCLAFISLHAVLKELQIGEFKVIDIKNFSIDRYFYFATLQGQTGGLGQLFIRFISRFYQT